MNVLSGRTVIRGVRVMQSDGTFGQAEDVLIDGELIQGIGAVGTPDGATIVDGAGCFVAPGIIDCHVHVTHPGPDVLVGLHRPFSYQYFQASRNLEALLACGVTTIRDAGGADLGVATAVEDGLIRGPRMKLAIQLISQTGGHNDGWCVSGNTVERSGLEHPGRPHGIVDGVDAMRKKVRELKRAGADWIKICASGGVLSVRNAVADPHFRSDELRECVVEAASTGTRVMAHAHSAIGIGNAVRAGVASIEHGVFLDDELAAVMVERGTWLVPTLSAPLAVVSAAASGGAIPTEVQRKASAVIERHREAVNIAYQAGVRIAMGTDSGVGPHGNSLDELRLLNEAGVPVAMVWRSATSEAAELLEIQDEVGSLRSGLRADLVLFEGDPQDLYRLKDRLRMTMLAGRVVFGAPPAVSQQTPMRGTTVPVSV